MNKKRGQEKGKKELQDQITLHVKPSDCYGKNILHSDDERDGDRMEKIGIEGR